MLNQTHQVANVRADLFDTEIIVNILLTVDLFDECLDFSVGPIMSFVTLGLKERNFKREDEFIGHSVKGG